MNYRQHSTESPHESHINLHRPGLAVRALQGYAVNAFLYRHFGSNDELLYVGISIDPFKRSKQHKRHSEWFNGVARIEIEIHKSRELALDAEREAIMSEQPLYNIAHKNPKKGKRQAKRTLSREELYHSTVNVSPMYSIRSAAEYLGFLPRHIKGMIERKELGSVQVPHEWRGVTKHKIRITGWQLLDWLETLENGTDE